MLPPGVTNNEAESPELHFALQKLEELELKGTAGLSKYIRIFEDIQLAIKWHLGLFKKAGKPSLYATVEGFKNIIKAHRWILTFQSIPCNLNSAMDDMC